MQKKAISSYQSFFSELLKQINNSPECSEEEHKNNPQRWHSCIYEMGLEFIKKSIEASNQYNTGGEVIDENSPIYQSYLQELEQFMNDISTNSMKYVPIQNRPEPAYAVSNSIKNLYRLNY